MTQHHQPQDILRATSNVIELKKDARYLFVFKGISQKQIHEFHERLCSHGLSGISIGLPDGTELEVIEQAKGIEDE